MCISFDELNNEQQSTVRAIFADLPRSDISWIQVLDLLTALNGTIQKIDSCICVEIMTQANYESGIRRGIFPYSDEQKYVGRHMIGYLQQYLRGVGVEPD